MRRSPPGILIALVHCIAASAQAPVVRDSAGIHVVENPTPLWLSPVGRRLDLKPEITIGLAGGAPQEQFGQVASALRLSDGTIVVGDWMNAELRVFDAAGKFVRKFGQRGEGPGDFKRIEQLFRLPGDTILVWDPFLNRLSWFTVDGKLRRTLAVNRAPDHRSNGRPVGSMSLSMFGRLQDGSLLAAVPIGGFNLPTGMYRDSLVLWHVARDGKLQPVATLYHGEFFVFIFESTKGKMFDSDFSPFTAKGSVAAGPKTFWYADGVHYELREYSPEGRLLQIVRQQRVATPVTSRDIAAERASALQAIKRAPMRDEANRQRQIDAEIALKQWLPYPKTFATFSALIIDASGTLWAREFGDSTQAQHWNSFDGSGRQTGLVMLPAGLDVFEIGADYVLGRGHEEDGAETIRLYRFVH